MLFPKPVRTDVQKINTIGIYSVITHLEFGAIVLLDFHWSGFLFERLIMPLEHQGYSSLKNLTDPGLTRGI